MDQQQQQQQQRRRRPVDVSFHGREPGLSKLELSYYVWANLTSLNALRANLYSSSFTSSINNNVDAAVCSNALKSNESFTPLQFRILLHHKSTDAGANYNEDNASNLNNICNSSNSNTTGINSQNEMLTISYLLSDAVV